ncbi:MAG: trypsin-like peptidase domain-containing protein [Pirellulales bacterium]
MDDSAHDRDDFDPAADPPQYAQAAPTSASTPPARTPASQPPADRDELLRPRRLVWVLVLLIVVLVLPMLIQRLQYANSYGKAKARVDAALEGLNELNLASFSQASRWVAQSVGESVVHIRTVQQVNGADPGDEWSYFFGPPEQYESLGEGSGVIVNEEGYIVTNNHVVENARRINVQLSDGRRVPAELIGSDPLTDIAVLKIGGDNLIAARWGESSEVDTGDLVWAVGSPFGLDRTVTFGIVSATGRRNLLASPYQDFLQTDAAVNPGNSGGPLVNSKGEVVGINTAIVGRAYQGISFAIPSSIAQNTYKELREKGRIARGWLGVWMAELTPELAQQLGVGDLTGVVVQRVEPRTPADEAGIEAGDIIVEWNGQEIDDPTTLSRLVAATDIGSEATVALIRKGERIELEVEVAERPAQTP